jgi:hypothetical protein
VHCLSHWLEVLVTKGKDTQVFGTATNLLTRGARSTKRFRNSMRIRKVTRRHSIPTCALPFSVPLFATVVRILTITSKRLPPPKVRRMLVMPPYKPWERCNRRSWPAISWTSTSRNLSPYRMCIRVCRHLLTIPPLVARSGTGSKRTGIVCMDAWPVTRWSWHAS